MPTQNVNLTPELEEFVKKQVSSGYYNNVSEVHRAALANMARLEEERQLRLNRLRKEIGIGVQDMEAGRFTEFSDHDALSHHLEELCDTVAADIKQEK